MKRMLTAGTVLLFAFAASMGAWAQRGGGGASPASPAQNPSKAFESSGDKATEMAKFENPEPYVVKPGPAGGDWDAQYRSFIQTSESAVSKQYPSHAEAAAQIKEDAAKSPENLQRHKGFIIFLLVASKAYRPEEATNDLKALYTDLVNMEFAGKAQAAAAPAAPKGPNDIPTKPFESSGDKAKEMAKWDDPLPNLVKPGPGGGDWDGHYRSFIQTSENAVAKQYPSHAEAAAQIKEDAAKSSEDLQKHKGFALYIKHFSQAYRPEEATNDLKALYADLVDMEFGGKGQGAAAAQPPGEAKPAMSADDKIAETAAKAFEGDPRLTIYRDVAYGVTHPDIQKLDAYILKSDKPTPVMVEIHGGGWRRGIKSQFEMYKDKSGKADLVADLLNAGISVVSIDYRLAPDPLKPAKQNFQMPAMMDDAARAIQFIRGKTKEWNIDPARIAAMGGSAGAHLAAWIATHDDMAKAQSADPVECESTRLSCFVAFAGPMDLTRPELASLAKAPMRGEDFAGAFAGAFGCTLEEFDKSPEIQKRKIEASPLSMVTKDDAPMFFVGAGSEDLSKKDHSPVPKVINDPHSAWYGVLMADAMDKVGVEAVRYMGPGAAADQAKRNADIMAFLRKHLGLSDGAAAPAPAARAGRSRN